MTPVPSEVTTFAFYISSLIATVLFPTLLAVFIARLMTTRTSEKRAPFLWIFVFVVFVMAGLINAIHHWLLIGTVYTVEERLFVPFNFVLPSSQNETLSGYTTDQLLLFWFLSVVVTLSTAAVFTYRSAAFKQAITEQQKVLKRTLILLLIYSFHLPFLYFVLKLLLGSNFLSIFPWLNAFEEAHFFLAFLVTIIIESILLPVISLIYSIVN